MGIDKCVKEAQNHNSILKAPQEHPSDQVVSQMVSWWQYRGTSPEGKKDVIEPGTLIAMRERERVRFTWESNTAGVIVLCSVKISVQYTAHYRGCEGSQQVTQGEKHTRHFSCGAESQQHDDD